jgi:hypothetical protein
MARQTGHIRQPLPRRGGNSFYRDTRDFTRYAATLCGAPVTSEDTDFRSAGTKVWQKWALAPDAGQSVCATCLALRKAVL